MPNFTESSRARFPKLSTTRIAPSYFRRFTVAQPVVCGVTIELPYPIGASIASASPYACRSDDCKRWLFSSVSLYHVFVVSVVGNKFQYRIRVIFDFVNRDDFEHINSSGYRGTVVGCRYRWPKIRTGLQSSVTTLAVTVS